MLFLFLISKSFLGTSKKTFKLAKNQAQEEKSTLSTLQRASLVEKSRQKPPERMRVLSDALKTSNYGSEPMLQNCEISISIGFTQVDGRVLPSPKV
ncbi:hypothetical protein HN51_045475 [Arachis hypogaea]